MQRAKQRGRAASEAGGERVRFASAVLPRWARRTRSLDALLPVLCLRGVSMGGFQEALGALLGREAPDLSPSVVARLRDEWQADHKRWQRRDLPARRHVHAWADGIHLQARREPQAECPTTQAPRGHAGAGRRHARGQEGAGRPRGARPGHCPGAGRRRRGAWLLEGAGRGVAHNAAPAPHGPQGRQCHGQAAQIRPAGGQGDLREAWAAPDRAAAGAAAATLADKHGAKHEKAAACLVKDRDALLAFCGFPAEPAEARSACRRDHLGTPDPIGSVLATVRRRTARAKGALSQDTARPMALKLVMAASKAWRRPRGENQWPKAAQGAASRNGVEVADTTAQHAA